MNYDTLQGTYISHRPWENAEKENHLQKRRLVGDMLLPRRVRVHQTLTKVFQGRFPSESML